MRKLTVSILGLSTAALLSSAAVAADLPSRAMAPVAPVPVVPVFSWTGFYLGGNIGAGFDRNQGQNSFNLPLGSVSGSGGTNGVLNVANQRDGIAFAVGGQAGFNYQFTPGSGVVLGAEADIQYITYNGSSGPTGSSFAPAGGSFLNNGVAFAPPGASVTRVSPSLDYYGTVRGRLGYAFGNVLVYGTGGFAYGDHAGTGYAAGGGLEYAISRNITIRAEAMHIDLRNGGAASTASYDFPSNTVTLNTHGGRNAFDVARAGFNYKFDLLQPAPVVARY